MGHNPFVNTSNTLSNVYEGHVIRDTFLRLVEIFLIIRDRLVLGYQVMGHTNSYPSYVGDELRQILYVM